MHQSSSLTARTSKETVTCIRSPSSCQKTKNKNKNWKNRQRREAEERFHLQRAVATIMLHVTLWLTKRLLIQFLCHSFPSTTALFPSSIHLDTERTWLWHHSPRSLPVSGMSETITSASQMFPSHKLGKYSFSSVRFVSFRFLFFSYDTHFLALVLLAPYRTVS